MACDSMTYRAFFLSIRARIGLNSAEPGSRAAAHKLQWSASCAIVIYSTQMSFQGRLAALEGKYFREEEVLATRRAVEKLIKECKLPSDALKALDEAQSRSSGITSTSHDDDSPSMHNLPTTVNRGRQAQQGSAAVPAQHSCRHSPCAKWCEHMLQARRGVQPRSRRPARCDLRSRVWHTS